MHRDGVCFSLALGRFCASAFPYSKILLHALQASVLAVIVATISGGLKAVNLEPIIAHCLNGSCPVWQGDDAADEIVVRQLFAAQIDSLGEGQLPRWVAYRIVGDGIGIASLLPREWAADTLLEGSLAQQLAANARTRLLQPDLTDSQDRDYRLTEVTLLAAEQERLAPMTSFSATPFWDELNLLSNRARLPSDLRQGPWSLLDQALNELAAQQAADESGRSEAIFVVSGPLQATEFEEEGFFKIAVFNGRYAAFAFASSTESHRHYCAALTTVDEIENRTQLTVFKNQQLTSGLALGCAD